MTDGGKTRTIEEFTKDAIALATRHGNPQVLTSHLKNWEASGHSPELLRLNILSILEFKRKDLSNRQIRYDVSVDQLRKIRDEAKDGTIERYIEDVITAKELVEWCNEYISHTTKQPTT